MHTFKYKKVIVLTGFYAPSIGGMEKRLEKWASVLIKNDIDVEIFTTAIFSDLKMEVVEGLAIIRRGSTFDEWITEAVTYVRDNSDSKTVILVAALGPGMDRGLLSCLEEAHANGSRVVMSVPTADHIARAIARDDGAKEFLDRVDRLITVSDDVEEFKKYCSNVVYLPNFVMEADILKNIDPYPLNDSIAFFGRIAKRKRPYMLVAIAQLLKDTQLIVQGPAGYGEMDLYNEIINKLKKLNTVVIKPNKIPDLQIINSKYFINPSEVEGCSNSLLEAMNRGSIPLISNIKENRKVLGGLVPLCDDDPRCYLDVMREIIESGRERQVQVAMRTHIINNYSESAISASLIEALTVFKDAI